MIVPKMLEYTVLVITRKYSIIFIET